MSPRGVIRSALRPLSRVLTRRKPRVLMFHRFGKPGEFRRLPIQVFDEQLRYLRSNFTVLPLNTIVTRLIAGEPLPASAVALTVDDGYSEFYDIVYPLIESHRVPVTLYTVGAFADGTEWLWMDKLQFLASTARPGTYEVPLAGGALQVTLGDKASRELVWELLADHAMTVSVDERDVFLRAIEYVFGLKCRVQAPPEFQAADWSELLSMDPDLVQIGCHSMSHPILSKCTPQRKEQEIVASKALLEAKLQRPVTSFCYPNGLAQDYDRACIDLVKAAGYTHAVTSYGGFIVPDSELYELPRVGAATSTDILARQIDGVSWLAEQKLFRGFRPSTLLLLATALLGGSKVIRGLDGIRELL